MNVGGSFGGGYGGYRPMEPSSYGASSSGATQKDSFEARRQSMPYGDSLIVSSLGRRESKQSEAHPEQTADRLKKGRIACWVLGAISLFVFSLLAVQPILLPLCTFGMCFSNGWAEWVEFTTSIFKMSLFPASLGVLLIGAGFICDQSLKGIESQLAKQEKGKLTPELVDLMLKQGQTK